MKASNEKINPIAEKQILDIQNTCARIKPMVVIECTAFNHGSYIRDALEGFVMQKTDFPFVAVVHDDASTDKTAEIIREYAERYPDIILPIFEKENQYSTRSLGGVMRMACEATGAKYIAICEGDDYWTDPLKLQKQVGFMQSHLQYSMCFHNVKQIFEGTNIYGLTEASIEDKEYSASEILGEWIIPTCSVLMKIEILKNRPKCKDFIVGDNVLWATCLTYGRVRGLSNIMGVYRRLSNGWTQKTTNTLKDQYYYNYKWIAHYRAMIQNFPKIDRFIFDKEICRYMAAITIADLKNNRKKLIHNIITFYDEYKFLYIKETITTMMSIVKNKMCII